MSDKKKRNLIIVLCILAMAIAIAAIALAPYGKKGDGNSTSLNTTENTNIPPTIAENTSVPQTSAETETSVQTTGTTFVIPPSTDPIVNPNKNYTFFIDKTVFEASEDSDGETVLTAKNNNNVKMIVTPIREMSYKECCRAAEKKHKELSNSAKLKIKNVNTAYRSQTGDTDSDIITTVYCVDDNKGGCIVIECVTPVGATKYMDTIEIMLSMFKVL